MPSQYPARSLVSTPLTLFELFVCVTSKIISHTTEICRNLSTFDPPSPPLAVSSHFFIELFAVSCDCWWCLDDGDDLVWTDFQPNRPDFNLVQTFFFWIEDSSEVPLPSCRLEQLSPLAWGGPGLLVSIYSGSGAVVSHLSVVVVFQPYWDYLT